MRPSPGGNLFPYILEGAYCWSLNAQKATCSAKAWAVFPLRHPRHWAQRWSPAGRPAPSLGGRGCHPVITSSWWRGLERCSYPNLSCFLVVAMWLGSDDVSFFPPWPRDRHRLTVFPSPFPEKGVSASAAPDLWKHRLPVFKPGFGNTCSGDLRDPRILC